MGHCASRPARVTNLNMVYCTEQQLVPDFSCFFSQPYYIAGAAG